MTVGLESMRMIGRNWAFNRSLGGVEMQANRVVFVLLASVLLPVVGLLTAAPPAATTEVPELREGAELIDRVGRTAPKLEQILKDAKQPAAVRLKAARLLGQLRYAPAIPTLIQHIALTETGKFVEDGPEYLCADALGLYGDAAVPLVVDAYLKTDQDDQSEEDRFLSAIRAGKTGKVAIAYTKGLAPAKPDPAFEQKLKLLVSYVKD